MSGIMLTQTTTIGQLVAVQTEAIADQTADAAVTSPATDHRRPVLGLIKGSAAPAGAQQTRPASWAIEQEHLRYNVFDEVVARLLEDDIEEAVV
jgi:hypothetical protein